MNSKVSRSALRKRKKGATDVKVALLGLDRITGSLGMALRAISDRDNTKVVFTVIGRDLDNEAMKTAASIGAIDNFNRTLETVVEDADIVFINEPMGELEALYTRLGPMLKNGAVVIDLSPLKSPSVKLAAEHFPEDANGKKTAYLVSATPVVSFDRLYATDLSVEASEEFLFRNSEMLIAPTASVPPEAVKVVTDIAGFLKMSPRFMEPLEHDGLASLTVSMPMLLSLLMFQTVQQSPGKLDILRAANLSFASAVQNLRHVTAEDLATIWRSNRDAMLQQVEQLTETLTSLQRLLTEDSLDHEVLEAYLEQTLKAFIGWEVRREKNRWDISDNNPLDNVQVGVPVIGQMFIRRRRREDE